MKRLMLLLCGIVLYFPLAQAKDKPQFVVCKSTYALCTTAKCTPVEGNTVKCECDVKTGYSASQKPCQGEVKAGQETQLFSRYYPVRGYRVCTNNRPWAWCLDKPCVVDTNNPSKAFCACTQVQNQGDYVIVTDKNPSAGCDSGIVSSATVAQITQITEFLKTQKELQPYKMNIIK